MNPLLDTIVRDLAHGEAASALPNAPIVPEPTPRAAAVRLRVGTALHHLAQRIEPRGTNRVEAGRYRTA